MLHDSCADKDPNLSCQEGEHRKTQSFVKNSFPKTQGKYNNTGTVLKVIKSRRHCLSMWLPVLVIRAAQNNLCIFSLGPIAKGFLHGKNKAPL